MNKKGKIKKGKVLNPSTPEVPSENTDLVVSEDVTSKSSEVKENIEEKIEIIKEERVPEILSDIGIPSVDVKNEETPKKPKRNKSKKKKESENDNLDNLKEKTCEKLIEVTSEEIKEDVLEAEPLDIAAPTTRKKKNKKKNIELTTEEAISSNLEQVTREIIKDVTIETEIQSTKQESCLILEAEEHELKSSKKKNKKKKRNDTEKSDKEVISCTTGFQQLIETRDESLEIKIEDTLKDDILLITSSSVDTAILPEITTIDKDSAKNTSLQEDKIQGQSLQDTPVIEKGKKKKEKKNIIHEDTFSVSKENITKSSDKIKEEKEIIDKQVKNIEPNKSPKPKAKIAKPVEKKHKDSQDLEPTDSVSQDVIETKPLQFEEQPNLMSESLNVKVKELESLSVTGEEKIDQEDKLPETRSDQLEVALEQFEPLNTPDKPMGKKGKKKGKIPKTTDVNFELIGVTESKPLQLEEESSKIVESSDLKMCKEEIVCVIATDTTEKDNNKKSTEGNVTVTATDQLKVITEKMETLATSGKQVGKKRKKESKMPKTPDVSFEILEHKDEIAKKESELVDVNEIPPLIIDSDVIQTQVVSDKGFTKESSKLNFELKPGRDTKEHVLLTPEFIDETAKSDLITTEKDESFIKVETKSVKTRKKSPKLHKNVEPIQKPTEPVIQETTTESLPTPEVSKEVKEKLDASNITRMYDIEISSMKGEESEEVIPEVTYPRAVSQPLMDNNNNSNIVAQITPLQEIRETTSSECKIKDTIFPPKYEKTDLKSKMMEVNQDMEELRLSIERSLAELSVIEKSEKETEERYEKSSIKSEGREKTLEPSLLLLQDTNESSKIQKTLTTLKPDITEIKTEESDRKESPEILENISPISDSAPESKTDEQISQKEIESVHGIVTESAAQAVEEIFEVMSAVTLPFKSKVENVAIPEEPQKKEVITKLEEQELRSDTPPICPARKDNKNKHKKKKGKQDSQTSQSSQSTQSTQSTSSSQTNVQEAKKDEKKDNKCDKNSNTKDTQQEGKQEKNTLDTVAECDLVIDKDFEPIENFEDALTSSVDDVNKTFELIANESEEQSNPKITEPDEQKTTVSPPKNLLGQPDIPASSNKRDYKKEKDKIPNEITANVEIKDAVDVERKRTKNTQTINKLKDLNECKLSSNEEFVYKYNFRKVFLPNACHVCKKKFGNTRLACSYCNLIFYCGTKHKDEDWPLHQALCFAVSTIGHLKDQKHIYADTKNITGLDYRLIRMQMIVSCEKILKRRLIPWEQEALLYPRVCANVACREWRQGNLRDCQGCEQISFCSDNEEHYPKNHSRWCKSYNLYQKLVCYQQIKGRLEPKLPTRVMQDRYVIPDNMNEVLAAIYEEKLDLIDIQYAALTQLATAPLTAAYCYQLCSTTNTISNGYKKAILTIHVVGAELQFEADALNKWEVFFLHLRPDLQELRVVLISPNLNPSNLPLDLLGKIKLCEHCRQDKRRVVLRFQDKTTYAEYKKSEDFIVPDIVCAFNPNIQRSSAYNGKDPWPSAINVILKQKIPFLITGYTITELRKDCIRIKECSEIETKIITEAKVNSFASVRPDRNFITDDEMPLLFKNYCYAVICG